MFSLRTSESTTAKPQSHVALITGASQGLGRAFAEACARRSIDLVLVALPDSGLDRVARGLELLYDVRTESVPMDLTRADSAETLVERVRETGLPVSMLINNAGVGYNARFEESTLGENESCVLLNNLALVKLTRLLLPELQRRERAFVLNVSSLAAFFPMPYMPVYGSSKAFILNFSLALRAEMRGTPVSVTALCPNGIRTNGEAKDKIEAHGIIGRWVSMDPEDVARTALDGMFARRAVIIPGFINQVLAAVGRHAPASVVCPVVSAFYGKTSKGGADQPVRLPKESWSWI